MQDAAPGTIVDPEKPGKAGKAPVRERDIIAVARKAAREGIIPRRSAVVELLVILLAIVAIDWLRPTLEIYDLQPSPFWLPVLLLSAQYGTVSGALAVVAAIAFHVSFATFPEQGVGENEFTYRLRTLAQPILWIAAALMLGQFRMQHIAIKRDLARQVLDLDRQRTSLADYAQGLRARCDKLEREIAGRPLDEARVVLSALGALTKPMAHADQARTVGRAIAAAYPGAGVSVYQLEDGALRWWAGSQPLDHALFLASVPLGHPCAKAILADRRALQILQPGDETALGNQGLAAVAIMAAGGDVIGMVKMETGPARFIGETLTMELLAIAQLIAPHIDQRAQNHRARGIA